MITTRHPRPMPRTVARPRHVTQAFSSRLPSQRVLDLIDKLEGVGFADLVQSQPFRIVAFRALIRDYPEPRYHVELWLHAYDVEVEITEENSTNGKLRRPCPILPFLEHDTRRNGRIEPMTMRTQWFALCKPRPPKSNGLTANSRGIRHGRP